MFLSLTFFLLFFLSFFHVPITHSCPRTCVMCVCVCVCVNTNIYDIGQLLDQSINQLEWCGTRRRRATSPSKMRNQSGSFQKRVLYFLHFGHLGNILTVRMTLTTHIGYDFSQRSSILCKSDCSLSYRPVSSAWVQRPCIYIIPSPITASKRTSFLARSSGDSPPGPGPKLSKAEELAALGKFKEDMAARMKQAVIDANTAPPQNEAAAEGEDVMIDLDHTNFYQTLNALPEQKLAIVMCYTSKCMPCQAAKPQIAEWIGRFPGGTGSVAAYKLALTLPNKDLALNDLGINSSPTFLFFKGGKRLDTFRGANKLPEVKKYLFSESGVFIGRGNGNGSGNGQ